MILYIEHPKEFTRNFLKLINTFRKVAGYTTNTQKSVTSYVPIKKRAEKEIGETIPLTIA